MRRIIFSLVSLVFVFFLISSISAEAELVINNPPKEVYNLGDIISVPVTIKSLSDTSGVVEMNLICNGQEINFYRNGVSLTAGEERKMESLLVLKKVMIKELFGDCKIKVLLGDSYILTNEFRISNIITVKKTSEQTEFEPGKNMIIKGSAVKETGKGANGFVEAKILSGNSSLVKETGTINNGFFLINVSLPSDTKAGKYPLKIEAYEKDSGGLKTNQGALDISITIKQVPNNLEIVFENEEIEPGNNLKLKTILHDQTGENIETTSEIKIKNEDGEIEEKVEKETDKYFEFPIAYNEPPANWTVSAISEELTAEANFKIKEKEQVDVELINKTVIIKNMGNVPYNKSVLVKVGNKSLHVDVFLEVDEEQKYLLKAPDGEYNLEILTNEGDKITGVSILTGREIEIEKISQGIAGFIRKPLVWIFVALVLGFTTLVIFRKSHKKSFFGFISPGKKEKKESTASSSKKDSLINTKNKAELSLSIKGEKQDASLVCLKIKNYEEIKKGKTNETLQKIIDIAKDKKAVIYENQENIFFILAPGKTKTFRNEKSAIEIAQKIKEILTNHNKLFKQKIEFGISLNYGTIIAKQQEDTFKFMSVGNLITMAKKIASNSNEEVLLSEKINERIKRYAKTEKIERDKINVYIIKKIKDTEENKKFINNFLKRLEKNE